MKQIVILIFSLSILFTSCEGMKVIAVTVVSAENEEPISDANVYFLNRKGIAKDSTKTDSLGRVTFDSGFTGMMFGGPKFKYKIVKDGFVTLEAMEKWPGPTLKMIKK
ncbi:MAG: hypothetical protein P1U44_04170 [Vicingaceae bacterium]|jgi:hypothetical protein|nr:hypothetical protein [Vicingaceae bacterium]